MGTFGKQNRIISRRKVPVFSLCVGQLSDVELKQLHRKKELDDTKVLPASLLRLLVLL